jgi:hypothetical protein
MSDFDMDEGYSDLEFEDDGPRATRATPPTPRTRSVEASTVGRGPGCSQSADSACHAVLHSQESVSHQSLWKGDSLNPPRQACARMIRA